ncbi:hypothetical protein SeMB42_g04779 [Synchytrium endobioticum]|uniref:NTF2 domain-containing protein n=1 Tax=Synchytrium endobioticum TaxID=286115 RepID=A0A507CW08_9FUNG|nr:hypothetical protein SeMB42_g04779 [Synchytrium endobioticum]
MAANTLHTPVDVNVCETKQPADSDVSKATTVGWLFVQQYYTFLIKEPNNAHLFYKNESQFTFGTECDQVKPRHGQQEVHQRIQELGLKDCQVKISNIDSQASSGGVLLQVLGEMSNQGGPAHKFAQTFFSARQTNGYYVLNDINDQRLRPNMTEQEVDAIPIRIDSGVSIEAVSPQQPAPTAPAAPVASQSPGITTQAQASANTGGPSSPVASSD